MLEIPQKIRAEGHDPCDYIVQLAAPGRLAELDLDRLKLKAWTDLAFGLVNIGQAYRPTDTVESVTVFYADPLWGTKEDWLNRELRQWDRFSRTANRYIEVPGEHNSLLGPKHVAAFQATLRAEIDRALDNK